MIINNIKTLLRIFLYSLSNLFVLIISFIIHRDKRYILFGSWMGEKYADNSRFLYQYLFNNKEKYGIKKVIWVTRNKDVYQKLINNGFESYLIGTKESTYWHLKSGIHIICNMSAQSGKHKPDIDVKFSTGAKKIQLWHGVGIKAVGANSNISQSLPQNRRSRWVVNFANKKFIRKIGFLGGWGEPKLLCTSELNRKINIDNSKIHSENAFISAYPRYCDNEFYFENERLTISKISKYNLSILYLPTFRDKTSSYKSPIVYTELINLLNRYNILWIQKPHQAELNQLAKAECENILDLSPAFDINTIIKSVDIIVSDYSSAAFDGIYLNKSVIFYVPDLNEYMNGSNGLLMNLNELCPSLLATNCSELCNQIQEVIDNTYFTEERNNTIKSIKQSFYSDISADYDLIWNDIQNSIK